MGHPSALTLGVPAASADGRLYARWPQGDKIISPGNASGAGATATGSAAGGSASGGSEADDWASRVAAPGVFYTNDFSTFADDAALHASNYGGTASEYQARTTLETRSGIHGQVCRLHITKEGDEGTPSYRHSWDGVGAQTKATVKKRFFYQWQMYIPAYVLDHRFRTDSSNPPDEPADLTSSVSHKFAIFQEPDVSFASGEVVITNREFRGFVTAYRHTGPTTLNFADSISGIPGGGSPDFRWQNAIDSGESVVTNADARRRYGPLQYSFPGTNTYGSSLSAQGNPDAEASVNGIPWEPDAINVVEVEIDADNQIFRLWHAVRGQSPKLVQEYDGNADIGARTNNYTGVQLLPRLEQLIADAGRLDTYVDYGELIASDNPIDFPGGHHVGAPTWFSEQADKTWIRPFTTFTTLDSVKPNPLPPGNVGHAGVVNSWSGAAPSQNGPIVYGGGHQDYAGNEVYFADLVNARFERLNDPSDSTGGDTWSYADGGPRTPHTYRHLVVVGDYLWLTSQAGPYPSGNSYRRVWRFHLVNRTWGYVGELPSGASGTLECGAVYNPLNGLIYVVTQYGHIWTINPDTLSMSLVYSGAFVSGANLYNALTIWPQVGALIYRASNGTISLFNIASPGWTPIAVSGSLGVSNYPGFMWHSRSRKILAWGHSANRANIFTLAPPNPDASAFADALGTWAAAEVTPHESNAVTPDAPASTGTMNRFGIIENFCGSGRDLAYLVSSTTEPMNVYKLPPTGL